MNIGEGGTEERKRKGRKEKKKNRVEDEKRKSREILKRGKVAAAAVSR